MNLFVLESTPTSRNVLYKPMSEFSLGGKLESFSPILQLVIFVTIVLRFLDNLIKFGGVRGVEICQKILGLIVRNAPREICCHFQISAAKALLFITRLGYAAILAVDSISRYEMEMFI